MSSGYQENTANQDSLSLRISMDKEAVNMTIEKKNFSYVFGTRDPSSHFKISTSVQDCEY